MGYYIIYRDLVVQLFGATLKDPVKFVGIDYARDHDFQLTERDIFLPTKGQVLGELMLAEDYRPILYVAENYEAWSTEHGVCKQKKTQNFERVTHGPYSFWIYDNPNAAKDDVAVLVATYSQETRERNVFGSIYFVDRDEVLELPHPCKLTVEDSVIEFTNTSNPYHTGIKKVRFKSGQNIEALSSKPLFGSSKTFGDLHWYQQHGYTWYQLDYYEVIAYQNEAKCILLPFVEGAKTDASGTVVKMQILAPPQPVKHVRKKSVRMEEAKRRNIERTTIVLEQQKSDAVATVQRMKVLEDELAFFKGLLKRTTAENADHVRALALSLLKDE
jgi:hypothetical protein